MRTSSYLAGQSVIWALFRSKLVGNTDAKFVRRSDFGAFRRSAFIPGSTRDLWAWCIQPMSAGIMVTGQDHCWTSTPVCQGSRSVGHKKSASPHTPVDERQGACSQLRNRHAPCVTCLAHGYMRLTFSRAVGRQLAPAAENAERWMAREQASWTQVHC
jgi:hypothetical protein